MSSTVPPSVHLALAEPQPPSAAPEMPIAAQPVVPAEVGGRKGPEPTRFGDWEKNGRCIDF